MTGITSRPIILLGGNVTVAASAALASDVSLSGAAFLRVGAAAALTAEAVLTPAPTQGHWASSTLPIGSIVAGVGTSYRLAHASLSASADFVGTGDGTFSISAEPFASLSALEAAGGVQFDAGSTALSATANLSIVNPGVLYDGGSVLWDLDVTMGTTVSPVFRLILPTRKNTFTRHKLFGRYGIDTGVAMLIKDGVVTFSEAPSDNELKDSDDFFLGGYRHQITAAQRAVIVSAGYGELVEEG